MISKPDQTTFDKRPKSRGLAMLTRLVLVAMCVVPLVLGSTQQVGRAVANSSFNFGPGSTYVEVNDAPELRLSNNFTIEAWVYLQDGTNETIIDKGPSYSYLFQVFSNGHSGLGLYANYGGNYNWVYSSAATIPLNQWSHVAVTFTNAVNGLKFWLNGNLVSEHTPAGALISAAGAMNLGRQEPGGCSCNRLQSKLDEVRIWNTARTQQQLQSSMMIEPAVNASGLVAYWDFNDGSGSSVVNRTATAGLNGTIVNFTGNSEWVSGAPRAASTGSTDGIGHALGNFVYGPGAQSASNSWQYFEVPDNLTSATLLANWQPSGNEIVLHQNQWDNNRGNGNYPFVQYVHSPTTSAFDGSPSVMIHPDDSSSRAAVAWKNTTGVTVTVAVAANLKFAYPGNNSNGITYALHRGLSGTARYSSLNAGTLARGSTATTSITETIDIQNGELVYLSVGNNGQYDWDHTIVSMSISIPVPTNTVPPAISGTTEPGQVLSATSGTWSGSPSSYSYQWKRASSAGGSYSNVSSVGGNTYELTNADVGYFFKVGVVATNAGGASSQVLSTATATGISSPTTTTIPRTTTTAPNAVTTTTVKAAISIDIQAPVSSVNTVAQGQASVATIAPGSLQSTPSPLSTTTTTPKEKTGTGVVTTTTSVAPSAAPAVAGTPPSIAKVGAGESAIDVGGVSTKAAITRENNQVVVSTGALSATLGGMDKSGKTLPLNDDGTVHLNAGDIIKVSVGGFRPASTVDVWLFSTPTKLGSAEVGADGTVTETFVLPSDVESGSHRVAVVAKLLNGKSATFTLGILVGEISRTSTLTRVLIAVPIAFAIGIGFILPNQLRRRRRVSLS